jgi:outer membrane immunogenic protein
MQKQSIATAAILALAGVAPEAQGADLSMKDTPVYEPAAFSWSGFYVGTQLGYGWGHSHDNYGSGPTSGSPSTTPSTTGDTIKLDGLMGGVHAGVNWQRGSHVFGIEGDLIYSGIDGKTAIALGTLSFDTGWQGSVRLRAGYAVDRTLFYLTGGLAVAEGKLTSSGTLPFHYTDKNTHVGWTLGGGLEYAVDQNWLGRIEARYTDFGSQNYVLGPDTVKNNWDQTQVMVGLSRKF